MTESSNDLLEKKIWGFLERIPDPEIPVLTILDLGMIRKIDILDPSTVEITITPTYSGCPAMDFIEKEIRAELKKENIEVNKIHTVLHPAWTTDWISEEAKAKLLAYGIAPPSGSPNKQLLMSEEEKIIACPQCKSEDTAMISQFGSTACKSLYKCNDCQEPFDYFKCI